MNAHDWHKRPFDATNRRCEICGCPANGTRRNGIYHRAVAESENNPARFVIRTPSPTGYTQKFIYELSAEQMAAIPSPSAPGESGPDSFLWHKLPWINSGKCQICGCPEKGIARIGQLHRAVRPEENIRFGFLVCWKAKDGFFTPLCPILPDGVSPIEATAAMIGPGDTTLALMARAAVLHAAGKPFPMIEEEMKLKRRTVATWRSQWREYWEAALRSGEAQIIKTVKAQIGTAGILDDIDLYMSLAKFAETIAERNGVSLFPEQQKPTVSSFFESYVVPTCLYDANPKTLEYYRTAIKLWRIITGDPPIESVTSETLALFRNALSKRRGIKRCTKASLETVASRLRAIQTILDKAGPPARRNRDAKGLIACAPWIRPPRPITKLPRVIPPELFKLVYDATAGMDVPAIPGIKAPAWWKALLIVTYNTQLRRRTLFEMHMDEIDWKGNCIRLPAERFKAGRPMIVHLNAAAMQALASIRTERELVFPLEVDWGRFHIWFHRLQNSAGIPPREHFGLHAIRKTAATVLAAHSPQAAQLALGHKSLTTTMNSYINPTSIIGAALDAMPQPFGL